MGSRNRGERGAGSLFHDKGLHRWVVMAPLPKGADGKRRRLRRTFKTRAEAVAFLAEGCPPLAPDIEPAELTVSALQEHSLQAEAQLDSAHTPHEKLQISRDACHKEVSAFLRQQSIQ